MKGGVILIYRGLSGVDNVLYMYVNKPRCKFLLAVKQALNTNVLKSIY